MASPTRTSARRARDKKAAGPSFWDRLSPRTQHAVCVGALLVITVAFWSPIVFGGLSLVGGDTVQFQGTAKAMLDYEASTGKYALWSPNVFGGMPGYFIHYPTAVPQLDSIPRQLREWGIWPMAHFFVLLLGAYGLVWYLVRQKWAGVLAAAAFGMTTYLPVFLLAGHNTKFLALAWAPWLLLAFAYTLDRVRQPGPLGRAGVLRVVLGGLLFAIAFALEVRAGHVQITYYLAFLLAFWGLAEAVQAVREGRLGTFALGAGVLVLAAGLGVLMVAQPLFVNWEVKPFTIRSAGEGGGLAWDYAMNWSQGWGELVTLLIPDAYGGSGQLYWGSKPFTAGPHYLGGVVLALAALAVWRVRRPAVWGLAAAAVVMTGFALGGHFALLNRPMFDHFPLFASFRAPETWLAAVALALTVLAGLGAAWLARPDEAADEAAVRTRSAYVVFGGMLALVAVLFVARGAFFSFEREGEAVQYRQAVEQQAAQQGIDARDPRVTQAIDGALRQARTDREDAYSADALRALLFLALAGALVVLARRGVLPPWGLAAGLALLVAVDLGGVGHRYVSADNPSLRDSGDVNDAVPQYDFDRFIVQQVQAAGGSGHFRTLSLASNPSQSARESYYYESLGGYHGAKLALYQDYLDRLLFDERGRLQPRGLDLMAARYVIAPGAVPGLEPVYQDPQTRMVVSENADALPRAFLVDDWRVVPDDEAGLDLLLDPAFDPRQTAVVYEAPPGLDAPTPAAATPADTLGADPLAAADTLNAADTRVADAASASELAPGVKLERYGVRGIVWRVQTDRPQLLVVNEVYYPAGWYATVDDQHAPILRANHLLRAVPVPAGEHLVEMRFRPATHERGLLISWAATALAYLSALALAGLLWYRRGHPTD